jgi:hypothetical protein
MARGEEKDTIGTKVESKVKGAVGWTGLGAGGATAISITMQNPDANMLTPEGAALTTGMLGSLAGGLVLGGKMSQQIDGQIADRIDSMKPQSMKSGEIYLDGTDPFDLRLDSSDYSLSKEQKQQIKEEYELEEVRHHNVTHYVHDQLNDEGQADEWVEELGLGEINGFQREFRAQGGDSGSFKRGYVDEEQEYFVQAPKRGDTFQEALERVETWKENKEALDQADQYLDQVLEKEGTEEVSKGLVDIEIDYDFLQENEEILREEIEDGVMTPSENYDIVVTSHDGDPFPVLVGEYNADMVEHGVPEEVSSDELTHRKQVVGMYMDSLVNEGVFEGTFGDYWKDEGYGREQTKNMFYDAETDTVGVTDVGEYKGEAPDDMPDLSIAEQYA